MRRKQRSVIDAMFAAVGKHTPLKILDSFREAKSVTNAKLNPLPGANPFATK
jgi:hypothetical protein